MKKTNAMRLLDGKDIDYSLLEYKLKDGKIDGISVAEKLGRPCEDVYKTLVCQGASGEHYVFVIPVDRELDFKKAAKLVGEKSVSMIKLTDLTRITGYVRGGCSPIGMKKDFKTLIQIEARTRESIIVSAGKKGLQIELRPEDLGEFLDLSFEDIIK